MSDNIRNRITEQIIASLKAGTQPWRQPWSNAPPPAMPCNFKSKRRYTGINPMLLMQEGFASKYWGSRKQWESIGTTIKTGERPACIVLYRLLDKKDKSGKPVLDGTGRQVKFPLLRQYELYNLEQVKPLTVKAGLKLDKMCFAPTEINLRTCRHLVEACGARIRHGGNSACYVYRPKDFIRMPRIDQFPSESVYFETLAHELCHWCEDPDRVGTAASHTYAFGELVSEIGACYLCAELGVPQSEQLLPRSAEYLSHWLNAMGKDSNYIFVAAKQASKVVDYLLAFVNNKAAQAA